MLFFRPQRPVPKQDHQANTGTPSEPPAGGRHIYGFRLWPAILISILLWACIIFAIRWLVS